jgi:ATP-dependent DNA helicase RecQ
LEANPKSASVLQVLLRTYGGVFEYDTKINTLLIAKKCGVPEELVLSVLEKSKMHGIVEYTSENRDMELTFIVPREDERTINVFANKINAINENKIANVNAMLAYIHNNNECRNVQLLGYFGEKKSDPCGKCDVCTNKTGIPSSKVATIEQEILNLLQQNACTSRKLMRLLTHEEDAVLTCLQYLLEDGTIRINNKNEYSLN